MRMCRMCRVREIEFSLSAELISLITHQSYKKIPDIKLCKKCANTMIENICFVTDQPKKGIT